MYFYAMVMFQFAEWLKHLSLSSNDAPPKYLCLDDLAEIST